MADVVCYDLRGHGSPAPPPATRSPTSGRPVRHRRRPGARLGPPRRLSYGPVAWTAALAGLSGWRGRRARRPERGMEGGASWPRSTSSLPSSRRKHHGAPGDQTAAAQGRGTRQRADTPVYRIRCVRPIPASATPTTTWRRASRVALRLRGRPRPAGRRPATSCAASNTTRRPPATGDRRAGRGLQALTTDWLHRYRTPAPIPAARISRVMPWRDGQASRPASTAQASRILFAVPAAGRPHQHPGGVAAELAARGHEVAWVAHRLRRRPPPAPGRQVRPRRQFLARGPRPARRAGTCRARRPRRSCGSRSSGPSPRPRSTRSSAVGPLARRDGGRPAGARRAGRGRRHGLPWVTSASSLGEFVDPLALLSPRSPTGWRRPGTSCWPTSASIPARSRGRVVDPRFSPHLVLLYSTGR